MKKIIYLLAILLINEVAFAQNEKVQKIKTEIKDAVIYLSGAEIHRTKKVNLVKGRNKIVFTNLSPKINTKSVRVSTAENVSLLAISNQINYLTNLKEKPKVKQLKDSLELLKQQNVGLANNKDAYLIEKDMLMKNKSIGGSANGVSIADLKIAADFYRSRIMEINKEVSKVDKKTNENNQLISKINNELYQQNAKVNYPRTEVTLLLNCDVATTTNIDLKYIVTNAGWVPAYDIKAKDINEPIDIIYRAKVYNNTDIDWGNISFKLSTGDPTVSATQPKLTPWYLNYRNQYSYKKSKYGGYQNNNEAPVPVISNDGYLNVLSQKRSQSLEDEKKRSSKKTEKQDQFIQIAVSELSAEFDIEKSYSIPSDNKPYIVDVIEYNVPALFKHYSVPKLDRDAFLLARIPNWEDLNLIEGNANIYFGGTFVGQSYISTRSVSDTLDISLGRDKKVIVTRVKMKDFSSKRTLGSSRKETHAYQIVVKNNRKVDIDIEVYGQIPVSQDSDIEVNAVEISKATRNDLTGELRWQYHIAPDKSQKIDLNFTVKYPKNKPVKVVREHYKSVRFL